MLAIHNTDAVSQSEHRANDYIYRQTDGQTDRGRQIKTDRQTPTDKQTERQTCRQVDGHQQTDTTDVWTDRHTQVF